MILLRRQCQAVALPDMLMLETIGFSPLAPLGRGGKAQPTPTSILNPQAPNPSPQRGEGSKK